MDITSKTAIVTGANRGIGNTLRVTAPLRIDIGGGVTDIPEFANAIGTCVLNIGVNLFEDELYSKPLKLSAEFVENRKPQSTLIYNDCEYSLNIVQKDPLYFIKSFLNAIDPKNKNYQLKITNELPNGTGLGGSGCLSILLTSLFSSNRDASSIIKKAHYTEVEALGIKGGFQDFIGAFYGNLNFITENNLENIDFTLSKNFGIKLKPQLKSYLDTNMVVVVRNKKNIPSEKIVDDEVKNYQHHTIEITKYLSIIKQCNATIFSLLQSEDVSDALLSHVGSQIVQSWEAQKKLSRYVCTDVLAEIEQQIKPYVYGLRGPGAAGNSLFMITKNNKLDVVEKLKQFRNEVNVYYLQTNESGLLRKII